MAVYLYDILPRECRWGPHDGHHHFVYALPVADNVSVMDCVLIGVGEGLGIAAWWMEYSIPDGYRAFA